MSLIIAKNKLNRNQLAELPAPEITNTHRPVKFSQLVDKTYRALNKQGYKIKREEFATARDNHLFFGGFALENTLQNRADVFKSDRDVFFGIRSSYNKSLAVTACMGNSLMVCENLEISSDIVLSRKNTKNSEIDISPMLNTIISGIVTSQINTNNRFEAYQNTEISSNQANDLIMDLAEASEKKTTSNAFPARAVIPTIKEFHNQRHDEFKGNHLWNLYNSVTENLKGSDLHKLPARTMAAQSAFDSVANFQAISVEDEIALAN